LPRARQVVLAECGHVPQVELPERTNGLIRDQIGLDALAREATPRRRRLGRALKRAAL
jgi:hypothetical protein